MGCLSCLERNKVSENLFKAGSRGKKVKIPFLFPCLPKLWTWNTTEGRFFCSPIKWIRWACGQHSLYFWSCLWFSPHGHVPFIWWTNNEGKILFVAWREKKRFLITVLGNSKHSLVCSAKIFYSASTPSTAMAGDDMFSGCLSIHPILMNTYLRRVFHYICHRCPLGWKMN